MTNTRMFLAYTFAAMAGICFVKGLAFLSLERSVD